MVCTVHVLRWKWQSTKAFDWQIPKVSSAVSIWYFYINSLKPRPNRRHFADDIFKCIFLNENASIAIKISLKFVPKGPINNTPALVQIMAWRRPGDRPLSEPMMVSLPTHICVTRPQWVKMHHKILLVVLRGLAQNWREMIILAN